MACPAHDPSSFVAPAAAVAEISAAPSTISVVAGATVAGTPARTRYRRARWTTSGTDR